MLQIITFGGCLLRRDDGTEIPVPRRRMALLVAIAAAGSRGMSREKLLALLWPELDEDRGRAALSQALYALRKDLGSEDAIAGTTELRADPAQVAIDRAEFLAAIADGQDELAVLTYRGPYLDGFHVREAPEFEDLIERERQDLAAKYAAALERLARGEGERGDHAAAVRLWRQRANLDPTDAGVAVALMRAMAAAGDRAGALRHAEVYTEILRSTADLPPEPMVLAVAAEIRGGAGGAAGVSAEDARSAIRHPTTPAASAPPLDAPAPDATPGGASDSGYRIALFLLGTLGLLLLLARFVPGPWRTWLRPGPPERVLAVTEFQDFAGDSLAGPLAELLRSSLANVPGLSVISAERMAEGRATDSTAGLLAVARGAGASEALNGALFRRPDGTLRFDLRRVDAGDGRVIEAIEIEGKDLFAITSEATHRLTSRYGVRLPDGEESGLSTSSLTAIRFYQAGLDAYYRGDGEAAHALFEDAVREDSAFAMAVFYSAFTAPEDSTRSRGFERAHQLGLTSSLREHLIIDVNRADFHSDPATLALAESLYTLFPREISGPFALGRAKLFAAGDFLGAARVYGDALRLHPVGFTGYGKKCDACTLRAGLVTSWMFADSFPAARAAAREWTRTFPKDPSSWRYLALVAQLSGDSATWRMAYDSVRLLDPSEIRPRGEFWGAFYLGHIARADSVLAMWMATARPDEMMDLYWIESQLRREQGRPRAAIAAMRESRRRMAPFPYEVVYQAQTYFDAGDFRAAEALWDSAARLPNPVPSRAARGWTWSHALLVNALMAQGDTAKLLPIADSMRQLSLGSGFARDRRLEHYVQGLYWAAAGDDRRALAEFRESVWSYTAGYTRSNLELGRTLLRLGQPRDAALVCGSALRAEMSASAQYVSRGELHDCVGRGWLKAGERDSARVHLAQAAKQWANAEPGWAARRDSVVQLLKGITP